MDLTKQCSGDKVSLLTLGKSDLDPKTPSTIMLMQLPKGLDASALSTARFVAQPSQQASLIVGDASYHLHKVETSNALVLVPPTNHHDSKSNTSNKRSKVTASGKTLTRTAARLLKPGGSGASFLELRPKQLRLVELGAALPVYENDSGDRPIGRSVDDLSLALAVSPHQVQQGLMKIQAYRVEGDSYCRLSEEVLLESYKTVLAALAESDADNADYAGKGVSVDSLVETAMQLQGEEKSSFMESVLRHCIYALMADDDDDDDECDSALLTRGAAPRLRLGVGKVAAWVARRLFQLQSKPWEETLFLSRWQAELPGVGARYQVQPSMLRRIAVRSQQEDHDESYYCWTFVPADALAFVEADIAWKTLWKASPTWTLDDLQPYLQVMVDATGQRPADLLLEYAKEAPAVKDQDGKSMKIYEKR